MRNGVLALALFMASCGGGGGAGTVPLSQFGARFVAAQCARVFRCCSVAQVQAIYGSSVTDESTCVAQLRPLGDLTATQLGEQQSGGRLRYDGAAAAACFQKMGTAACTATSNEPDNIPECSAYIVPLVETGGACSADLECKTGFCDRPAVSGADGVCAVVPTKGMPCTSRCAPGSTCDLTGMCVDPKPDGSTCFVDEDCVSGNCDNPNLTGGTCAAPSWPTCGPAA